MEEELKRDVEEKEKETIYFDVYKTATGLYIPEEMCQMYDVGDRQDYRTLREKLCYRITEDELHAIEERSSYKDIQTIPNIITLFDLQLVLSFTVYVDKKHEDKLYILNTLCSKYDIFPKSKRIIEGITYCNVTPEDIDTVEECTKKEKIILKRKYVDIELDDEIQPAEYLFIYYYDFASNTSYVQRDMYELIRRNQIEIEGKPKIIRNRNCYSITEKELKEVELKMGYRGIQQLIKPKIQTEIPPKEDIQEIVDQFEELKDRVEQAAQSLTIPKMVDLPVIPKETVLIYQDKRNKQLYIPTNLIESNGTEPVEIMHKQCYITGLYELEKLKDKNVIIASVYPISKKEYNVLICNNNGQLYISKDMLDELGFYIENPHRIIVNKEIYEEITEDDVDLIRDKESDQCHINIIVKQITPKRG